MELEIYNIAIFIGILMVTIVLAYLANRFFVRLIRRSTETIQNDPTNYIFLRHAIIATIYTVGFGSAIYSVPQLRTLSNSLLAGAGILAVAVGFASQHALGNIISGFFIILFKPFKVNDRLEVRDLIGIVEDVSLRHTIIRDFENKRIIIPNTIISNEIIINANIVDNKICRWIDVGISYDSDVDLAKEIMADEVLKHPLHIDPRTQEQIDDGEPEVIVRVLSLGEFSVILRAWAWAKDAPDGFVMSCDLLESIKKRFEAQGIEIPFPHRTLVYKENNHPAKE